MADSRFRLKQSDSRAHDLSTTLYCPSYYMRHDSRILVNLHTESNLNSPLRYVSYQPGSDYKNSNLGELEATGGKWLKILSAANAPAL